MTWLASALAVLGGVSPIVGLLAYRAGLRNRVRDNWPNIRPTWEDQCLHIEIENRSSEDLIVTSIEHDAVRRDYQHVTDFGGSIIPDQTTWTDHRSPYNLNLTIKPKETDRISFALVGVIHSQNPVAISFRTSAGTLRRCRHLIKAPS